MIINSSYWIGAAMASAASVLLLDSTHFAPWLGWRLVFGIGAALGLVVIFFRRWIPESPRWLVIHGRPEEAERIVASVESLIRPVIGAEHVDLSPTRIRMRSHTPWRQIWHAMP